jgi:hypothetical protein
MTGDTELKRKRNNKLPSKYPHLLKKKKKKKKSFFPLWSPFFSFLTVLPFPGVLLSWVTPSSLKKRLSSFFLQVVLGLP